MAEESGRADAVVMTAAVADFRPDPRSDAKIKKVPRRAARRRWPLELNPDILPAWWTDAARAAGR